MNAESKNSSPVAVSVSVAAGDDCSCLNPAFCIHNGDDAPPPRRVRFAEDTECSHRDAPVVQEYSTFFYIECDLCGQRGERDKKPDELWP